MQDTPRSDRTHIGIFGRRNAGKSSLINAMTGQETALVSEVAGTTTDPVSKAMEVPPLGPVLFIDTAGLDDLGTLGGERIRKSLETLPKCDLVLLVIPADTQTDDLNHEDAVLQQCRKQKTGVITVFSYADRSLPSPALLNHAATHWDTPVCRISSHTGEGIQPLLELLAANTQPEEMTLAGHLIPAEGLAVLVTPIDSAAPKGRLILPQVQTIRDILDHDGMSLVVKERELPLALSKLAAPPDLVITDSQAFREVAANTPQNVPMTSFSIIFARYRGDLGAYIEGIDRIAELNDGDKILIAEACTHHLQSDDIGTVKIPRWLREATGKELHFKKVSGSAYPDDLQEFALIIHCGGCMLNRRAVLNRISIARANGIPITNYGMVIAWSLGILKRALAPFAEAAPFLDNKPY